MTSARPVLVEISPGELFDKITVLLVKLDRIIDESKLHNVRVELEILRKAQVANIPEDDEVQSAASELRLVNSELYQVIEDIYACERAADWGDRFVQLAREVYRLNDRRAVLKRKINSLLGSRLVEEKGHLA